MSIPCIIYSKFFYIRYILKRGFHSLNKAIFLKIGHCRPLYVYIYTKSNLHNVVMQLVVLCVVGRPCLCRNGYVQAGTVSVVTLRVCG